MKYKYVSQVDSKDCGVAALSMIMSNYDTNIPLVKIREFAQTDINGTTALGIVNAAKHFNFNANVIHAKEGFLEENTFTAPFIVHVIKNNELIHYYVVYKIFSNHILIADPDSDVGISKMSKEKFYNEWTGIAIFVYPNEDYEPVNLKEPALTKIFPIVFKRRNYVAITIISALVVLIINIVSTLLLQRIVDIYIPNQLLSTISIISIGLVFIYIFQQIFGFIQNLAMNKLGKYLTANVLKSFIGHVFKLPIKFFSTRRTGEIVSRFNDTNTIVEAISSTIITIFLDVSMIVIISIILLIQNSKLFFLVIAVIPVFILIIVSFFKPLKKINADTMQSNSIMSSSIIEDLNGISTIKSLKVEDVRFQKINSEIDEYLDKIFKNNQIRALQDSLKVYISLALNVAVLWLASTLVITNQATFGQVISFTVLISYFLTPLENIINLQPKIQSAQVAYNRLNEIFLVEQEELTINSVKKFNLEGDIEFNKVSYSYGFNKTILKDISVQFEQNKITSIVGPSGSGKSTLAKLLVRFIEKNSGDITINHNNIEDIDLFTLRTYVNYLPQEPYIFSGTILNNLLLGVDSINQEKITKILDIVGLTEEINEMPLGINTYLSSDNITISGGQKQRISLARSLLTDSPILILDEATSQVDILLEKQIIERISQLSNKTIIFITHRLEVAKFSDHIVVLKSGEIIESGCFNELIEKNGYFNLLINPSVKGIGEEDDKMLNKQTKYEEPKEIIGILENFKQTMNEREKFLLNPVVLKYQDKLLNTSQQKLEKYTLSNFCLEIANLMIRNEIQLSESPKQYLLKIYKKVEDQTSFL